MKQWCLLVLGVVVMLAAGLQFGAPVRGGAAVGVSGRVETVPQGVVSLPAGATVEIPLPAAAPPVQFPSWAGFGIDLPLAAAEVAVLAEGTRVRFPPGPHLDFWGESGPPAQVDADPPGDKEELAAPTKPPEPVTRERLEDIVREYFPGDEYDYAAAVVACESSWNPDAIWTGAKNKTPQTRSAAGLWQFVAKTWLWVADDAGVDADLSSRLDPVQATKAARFLVDRAGGGWAHWECAS